MGGIYAPQRPTATPGDVRIGSVSFANQLDSGELLTGTPTVVEVTTTDLTITNKVITTTAATINSVSALAGQAVQFLVSGMLVAHSPYTIKITAVSNSTPAQTFVRYVRFDVEN